MRRILLIILAITLLSCSNEGKKEEVSYIPVNKVGSPATDFLYKDMDGKPFRLSEKKGQAVILYFWRMKCVDCKEDMKTLEALNAKYREKGLLVVAVGADTMHSADVNLVREFLKNSGFNFLNIRDEDGFVSEAYDVLKAPQAFVIDKNGKLAHIQSGRVDWTSPEMIKLVESII